MQGLPLLAGRRNTVLHVVLCIAVPVVLLLTILSQTVMAQNTFVITEGDQIIVHKTHATDPAAVLEEAGIKADPHEYRMFRSKENVYDIQVMRDDTVVVINCGEKMYVAVAENTVGELLTRVGVPTGDGYEISCDLGAEPVNGMTITVNCLGNGEEQTAEPLINNGVAVFPSGEAVSCYDLEAF